MKIYLARHGQANSPDVDPEKNLSGAGRKGVQEVANLLGQNKNIQVKRVLHSGKSRAKQTAEILAEKIATGVQIEQIDGINPNDPVIPFLAQINNWTEDTLVVGHLPYMGKLVSLLLASEEINSVIFYPATIVCLEKMEGQWMISWVVGPGLIR